MDTKRNYTTELEQIRQNYYDNHVNQTFYNANKLKSRFSQCRSGISMSIWEMAEMLNEIVDESDPDLNLPQIVHLLQTAEAIKKDHPDKEWLILTGFIHDLGKILAHKDLFNQPQWAVVGDTFPVGCGFSDKIIYHEFFKDNPDYFDKNFHSRHGMYEANCGFDNVLMSWGHDEYMYQVCIHNKCTLPEEALYIIRYHSFYAHHKENAYRHLMSKKDYDMLSWLKLFQKYDLYSKEHIAPSAIKDYINNHKEYYQCLISKYFPTKVRL